MPVPVRSSSKIMPKPFRRRSKRGVALVEYTLILVTFIVLAMAAVNSGTTRAVIKKLFANTANPSTGDATFVRSFGNM